MLKQLSELRRTKEKKALQMKELIDKAEEYIRINPPQPVVYFPYEFAKNPAVPPI